MKYYQIYWLFTAGLVLGGCVKEDNASPQRTKTKLPTIIVNKDLNSADLLTQKFESVDSIRIGEKIRFYISATSNEESKAPLTKYTLIRMVKGKDTMMMDYRPLNDTTFFTTSIYNASNSEGEEQWKFSVVDSLGASVDTVLDIRTIDSGIYGRWNFEPVGIDQFYAQQDFVHIQFFFDRDSTYWIDYSNTPGDVTSSNGTYSQWKNNSTNTWNLILNQNKPEQAQFMGVFKILTPSPDSIYVYYAQTDPDVGVTPSKKIKSMSDLVKGEHALGGVQFNRGIQ